MLSLSKQGMLSVLFTAQQAFHEKRRRARCLFVKICFHHSSNSAWTLRRRIYRETIHVMRLTIFFSIIFHEKIPFSSVINCSKTLQAGLAARSNAASHDMQ